MSSFDQLPFEVLCSVFCYLDIQDILRIRRVSRYLNRFSHSRGVWSDAYRKAGFIRPPGPFLSQSARDLEDVLVRGLRVHQNLLLDGGTARVGKPTTKLREIRYTGESLRVSLVFGRFLFIALREEIRCYDLNLDTFDSNSGATIVYRSAGSSLRSFHCVSAVDVEGCPFACAILSEATRTGLSSPETTQISIYLVNVDDPSEVTLDLLYRLEYPVFYVKTVNLGPRVILIHGHVSGPDVNPDRHLIALDVVARMHFLLPSLGHAKGEADSETLEWTTIGDAHFPPVSVSTSTHLLVAWSFYTQATGWKTFLQAFALPPSNGTHHHRTPFSSTLLNPSHQGIILGINMGDSVLLQDSMLDPAMQGVSIIIRVHAFESTRPNNPISKIGLLRLATPLSASRMSRMSLGDIGPGGVVFQLLGSLGQFPNTPFLHSSFDGTGRVFYTPEPWSNTVVAALEYDVRSRGAQGTGEHAAKVVEHACILRFPTLRRLLDYDPYSGRICLESRMRKYTVIEIIDLAV